MVNAQIGIDMKIKPTDPHFPVRRTPPVRLGYIRLLDAAPLIVAERLGLFREAGLEVELSREAGWATIRDKLAFGDLDVAQALSPMPFVMQLGIGVVRTDVLTGLILNCNGNAITLSTNLRAEGVEDGPSLRRYIRSGYRPRKPVFGVVSLYSSHHFLLCRWLEAQEIDPRREVIIAVLPPEQMVRNLASENIDGFCVGEPWNSVAVEREIGWCPVTSAGVVPGYPEKVLATTGRFASYHPEEYRALVAVLLEACAFCDDPANHPDLLRILSLPEYLDCPADTLSRALGSAFPMGCGATGGEGFVRFHGEEVNRPTRDRMRRVLKDLCRYLDHEVLGNIPRDLMTRVCRESIYDEALGLAACS